MPQQQTHLIPDLNVRSVFAMQTCGALHSYTGNLMPDSQTNFNHGQLRVYFATARERVATHFHGVGVITGPQCG